MRFAFLGVTALCVALAGCYPAARTVQPHARFIVKDSSGRPIENATVTLATHRMPFPSPLSRTMSQFQTDAAGKVSLQAKHVWHWQVMLPDGTSWYEWIYCIEKPGYRAVFNDRPEFGKTVAAVLEPSEKRSVCKWPTGDQSYYQLSVVED